MSYRATQPQAANAPQRNLLAIIWVQVHPKPGGPTLHAGPKTEVRDGCVIFKATHTRNRKVRSSFATTRPESNASRTEPSWSVDRRYRDFGIRSSLVFARAIPLPETG